MWHSTTCLATRCVDNARQQRRRCPILGTKAAWLGCVERRVRRRQLTHTVGSVGSGWARCILVILVLGPDAGGVGGDQKALVIIHGARSDSARRQLADAHRGRGCPGLLSLQLDAEVLERAEQAGEAGGNRWGISVA